MTTDDRLTNAIIITRLLQLAVLFSFLSFGIAHFPEKQQIIKFLLYGSLVIFTLSIYYLHEGNPRVIARHFNYLALQIWIYITVLVNDFFSILRTLGHTRYGIMNSIEQWSTISIDYFLNFQIFAGIIFLTSLFLIAGFKSSRSDKNFLVRIIGLNLIMFATYYIFRQVLYYFLHVV